MYKMKEKVLNDMTQESFLFINAWNEWGEQMLIEPSVEYGYQTLKIIQEVCK